MKTKTIAIVIILTLLFGGIGYSYFLTTSETDSASPTDSLEVQKKKNQKVKKVKPKITKKKKPSAKKNQKKQKKTTTTSQKNSTKTQTETPTPPSNITNENSQSSSSYQSYTPDQNYYQAPSQNSYTNNTQVTQPAETPTNYSENTNTAIPVQETTPAYQDNYNQPYPTNYESPTYYESYNPSAPTNYEVPTNSGSYTPSDPINYAVPTNSGSYTPSNPNNYEVSTYSGSQTIGFTEYKSIPIFKTSSDFYPQLNYGSYQTVYKFDVTAKNTGDTSLKRLTFKIEYSGLDANHLQQITSWHLYNLTVDRQTPIVNTSPSSYAYDQNTKKVVFDFPEQTIAKGKTIQFSISANVFDDGTNNKNWLKISFIPDDTPDTQIEIDGIQYYGDYNTVLRSGDGSWNKIIWSDLSTTNHSDNTLDWANSGALSLPAEVTLY